MDPKHLKLIVKCIINYILFFAAAIGTSAVLCLWIPSLVYKRVVTIVAKVFRRDLRGVLDPYATLATEENYFETPSNYSIVAVLRIDGNLGLAQVRSLFQQHVIQAKIISRSNVSRYPQLQQYPVNFGGYLFWKMDATFNLSNHVEEHEQVSMLPISKIHQEMLNKKYLAKRSPWQVSIFRSAHQHRTYLALRMHHCISDGRSILKLIVECLGNKTLVAKETVSLHRTVRTWVNYLAFLPIGLVRLNTRLLKSHLKTIGHPWKCSRKDSSSLFVGISGKISVDKLNDISRVLGVSATAVIISTITGAITKFLNTQNPSSAGNFKSMPLYLNLPKEGQPLTFGNHQYVSIHDMPHVEDDVTRLKKYNQIYNFVRKGNQIQDMDSLFGVVSTLPSIVRRPLSRIQMLTMVASIAGDQEGFLVGGYPCLAFSLSIGALEGSTGITFTILSFKDDIQVSVVGRESFFKEKDVITMARLVEREFLSLSRLILG